MNEEKKPKLFELGHPATDFILEQSSKLKQKLPDKSRKNMIKFTFN